MDGWTVGHQAGGKLSVTAVRYQITDTGSSLEGRLISISGSRWAAATDSPTPHLPPAVFIGLLHVSALPRQ